MNGQIKEEIMKIDVDFIKSGGFAKATSSIESKIRETKKLVGSNLVKVKVNCLPRK